MINEDGEWIPVSVEIPLASGKSQTVVHLANGTTGSGYVEIDQMVWEPEGGSVVPPEEPREPVAIPQAVSGLTYDGKEKTGVLAGEGYWITGNTATRSGDYEAVATPLYGYRWDNGKSDDTNAVTIAWSIGKAVKDLSGVKFEDKTFVYDGTEHAIAVSGTLPDGVTVTYEGGASRTAAGTNEVKACFAFTDPSDAELYELRPESLSAKLIVKRGRKDVDYVTFDDVIAFYDGTAHSISVTNDLPDGVEVVYTPSDATNRVEVGTNEVTVTFKLADPDNYEPIAKELKARLIVLKGVKDVSGVTFPDAEFTYDGQPHSFGVVGEIPDGVELVYAGETNRVDAGTNEVTVTFKLADPDNYEPIDKELKARLIVLKGEKDVSNVMFPDAEFTYDGQPHSFGVVGEIPDGVEVVYDGATSRTEVGVNVVTASFRVTDPSNWNEIARTLTAKLAIVKPDEGQLHPDGNVGDFSAQYAATYNGWLRQKGTGAVVGSLMVKTAAAKAGKPCKVTITVTPLGGKKKTFKTSFAPGAGEITDEFGITYGSKGLIGTFRDGILFGEPVDVEAAKDFSKAKDADEKALAETYPVGCYTAALGTDSGFDCLSVTVAKKTGKAKVSYTLDDGTKISVTSQGVLGGRLFAVPVMVSQKKDASKRPVSFGLVMWIDPATRDVKVTGVQGGRWPEGIYAASELVQPPQGEQRLAFDLPEYHPYLKTIDQLAVAPVGAIYSVSGKKWDAGKTVGSVKVDKITGEPYVQYKPDKQVPANLSNLKFSYTSKTGVVKGSFKLYYVADGKLKTDSATISGIVVNGLLHGNAVIKVNKKVEHFPLWSEIPESH